MRTATDALRSLNRYVALALGDDWEVRLSSEKGTFYRPFARVIQVPSVTFDAESWHTVRLTSSYQVVAFPERADSPDDSQLAAMDVVDRLWVALSGQGVGKGHVARVPLYDYAGIPFRGPDAFATEDDRDPHDYMKLASSPDLQVQADPDDEYLWSVTANIRMSWLRSAAVPSSAETIVRVDAEAQPDG